MSLAVADTEDNAWAATPSGFAMETPPETVEVAEAVLDRTTVSASAPAVVEAELTELARVTLPTGLRLPVDTALAEPAREIARASPPFADAAVKPVAFSGS